MAFKQFKVSVVQEKLQTIIHYHPRTHKTTNFNARPSL